MIFKFLGSLYFALTLIFFTVLFVIAGTFLEALKDSHLFAAQFTYKNPIFQLLLWLYFINILFSALSRYPFEKKHIPFLLTHLGLLFLLFGVFIKNHYGVQGVLVLPEGSASSEIELADTYALKIESPAKQVLAGIRQNQVGPLESHHDSLKLTLLEWTPHAEEHYEGFIKGGLAHVIGLPPFEIRPLGEPSVLKTEPYELYAIRTDDHDAIQFPGKAALFFIQDTTLKEHLVAFNNQGERFSCLINTDVYYIYNKGFGGVALFAELPPHFPQLELITPLTRTSTAKQSPEKVEERTPRIRLLAQEGSSSEIVTLTYDKQRQKFKWPILKGHYLVKFMPQQKQIPLKVRLRSAKQINYPQSSKPYSFEAKVLIDETQEATLSMNHVYEKSGYRLYLSNLISSTNGANWAHIVVNHDPAKYILTYPGAILLALGILLLYFQKRYV